MNRIKQYIADYEKGTITVGEIATIEGVSIGTINGRINEYYKKAGRERPKYTGLINKILNLLKCGYTKEQIRQVAERRSIFISDEDFEEAEKLITIANKQKEIDEIPM